MKFKFLVLTVLAAGATVTCRGNNPRSSPRPDCNESTTTIPSTLSPSTSAPVTTTFDPCLWCRNEPITITDTWVGKCFADGEGEACTCICGDRFCFNGEVIDRSTCKPDGLMEDCICISTSTEAPTTPFSANF